MQTELKSNSAGVFCLACGKRVTAALRSGNAPDAEIRLAKDAGGIRVYRLAGWVAQQLNGKLYVAGTAAVKAPLQVTLEETVTLTPAGGSPAIPNATGIVFRRKGTGFTGVVTSAAAAAAPRPGRTPPVPPAPPSGPAAGSAAPDRMMAEELKKLRRQLDQAQQQLTEASRKKQEAEDRATALQGQKQALETRLAGQMTEAARQLRADRNAVEAQTARAADQLALEEENLRNARETLNRVQTQTEERIRSRGEMEKAIAAVQEQALAQRTGERELAELDEAAVREELEQARARLMDDRDVAELLAADPATGAESVRDGLRRAAEALENAEQRIRAIVALRERICESVQKAIDDGDGRVTTKAETGEEA